MSLKFTIFQQNEKTKISRKNHKKFDSKCGTKFLQKAKTYDNTKKLIKYDKAEFN